MATINRHQRTVNVNMLLNYRDIKIQISGRLQINILGQKYSADNKVWESL